MIWNNAILLVVINVCRFLLMLRFIGVFGRKWWMNALQCPSIRKIWQSCTCVTKQGHRYSHDVADWTLGLAWICLLYVCLPSVYVGTDYFVIVEFSNQMNKREHSRQHTYTQKNESLYAHCILPCLFHWIHIQIQNRWLFECRISRALLNESIYIWK